MSLADVTGLTIQSAGFGDHEFKIFVQLLLETECDRRHRAPEISGPTKDKVGDGGRDAQITIVKPPTIERDDAGPSLTWDDLGSTWYSCKTTSREKGWKGLVQNDLGWPDYNRYKNGKKLRKDGQKPSVELLRALEIGSRYVIVVNEQAGSQAGFLDEVARVFTFWFQHHPKLDNTALKVPANLRDQLEFIDATHLAWVIRYHKPPLPRSFREKLEVTEPEGLQDWDSWSKTFFGKREPTGFVSDPKRADIIEMVGDTGSNSPRAIRVFGAPGVGKTRAIYRALELAGSQVMEKTRYCDDIRQAKRIIESPWISNAGSLHLVLDEATTADVAMLASRFLADADPQARLMLIGTSDGESTDDSISEMRSFHLEGLADPEARMLIEKALQMDEADGEVQEARVRSVLHLSEGYPLFAVLLAQAFAKDGDSIDDPRNPANQWGAAKRVLAGARAEYADAAQWQDKAEIRAKCLLVVLLTHESEFSWDELWQRYGEAFASVFGKNDAELIQGAARECEERELLRYSGVRTRRYVSPRNLARIIINRFIAGPDDLEPKIRRHLPELHGSLLKRARLLQVRSDVCDRLARGQWDGLIETLEREGIDAWMHGAGKRDGLYLAATHLPEFAAYRVRDALTSIDDAELAEARWFREQLRPSLEHLSHRKLSASAFAAVEEALFALVRFDEELWSNSATQIWQRLFYAALDGTHRPWNERLALLQRRLSSPDLVSRRLATSALGVVVEADERGTGYGETDKIDGPWPGRDADVDKIVARKAEVWNMLLARCQDHSNEVAEMARVAVAERIGDGIGRGLFEPDLRELREQVSRWTPTQRQALAEALAEVRRYETDQLSPLPSLLQAVKQLEKELQPRSFRERLIEHVGRWHPGPWPVTDDGERPAYEAKEDNELIDDALADPELLKAEIPWLLSDAAKRKGAFSARLGQRDRSQRFLSSLEAQTRESGNLVALARYIEGWAQSDDQAVDRWLAQETTEPRFSALALSVVPRLAPSRARLHLLQSLIDHGNPDSQAIFPLATERWLEAVPNDELVALVEDIVTRPGLAAAVVVLGVALLARPLPPPVRARLIDALARGAREWTRDHIAIFGQERWQRAIELLFDEGRRAAVVDALLAAMDLSTKAANIALAGRVLNHIVERGSSAELWSDIALPMLEREPRPGVAQQLFAAGLFEYVDHATVLQWVGNDVERGMLAAHMTSVRRDTLDEIARALLLRFGTDSAIADQLHAISRSSVHGGRARVGNLEDFYRRQLQHAEGWSKDSEPEIRRWAERVAQSFRASVSQSEQRRRFERHYG